MFDPMYSRYILAIAALIVIVMMDVVYFSKPKISKKIKHQLYAYLIIVNTLVLIVELLIMGAFWLELSNFICVVLFKLRDLCLVLYFTFVLFYYYASFNNLEYKSLKEFIIKEKILIPHYIFTVIFLCIHFFLPYNYMTKESFNYTFSGIAFYATVIYGVATTTATLILVIIKNNNKNTSSQIFSIVWLFIGMVAILILQLIFTGANIMALISSIYILGLYFIYENPDLELVEQVDSLTSRVEKTNNSKITFLSNVTKEMLAPINTIAILSDGILDNNELTKEEIKADIKQIELSSKNFLEIISNTLKVSNVRRDDDRIVNVNYSLINLINNLVSVIQERIGNKQLKIEFNIDNTIPDALRGDYLKIYQILLNIITNSIKYTNVGKISISLSKEIKNSTIILKFKISDTGYGIKEEDFDKIFEEYTRLDDAILNGIEGTGLGLSVTKKYVNQLEGHIWFESTYGAGTTFFINLPQRLTNDLTTIGEASKKLTMIDQNMVIDCSKYRILLVEDDPLNLEVTKRLFEQYGFIIDTSTSGDDCIYKYKKGEKYDMILIDHEMPNLNGLEVMHIIRKLRDYQAPPLVALTANAFAGSKEVYISEGFDDYLPKPIDMLDLNLLINNYFKK